MSDKTKTFALVGRVFRVEDQPLAMSAAARVTARRPLRLKPSWRAVAPRLDVGVPTFRT